MMLLHERRIMGNIPFIQEEAVRQFRVLLQVLFAAKAAPTVSSSPLSTRPSQLSFRHQLQADNSADNQHQTDNSEYVSGLAE